MRLALSVTAGFIAAFSGLAQAQTAPKNSTPPSALPTVEKPKSVAPLKKKDPEPEPAAEPEVQPDVQPTGAQDQNAPARPLAKGKKNAEANIAAADGSASAQTDANTGPEYTGPSILSRGMNFTRPALPSNEKFRPFVGINLYHDSGVTGPYQGLGTKVVDSSYTGADINFGITGQHARRFDTFQLDFRGHTYLNQSGNSQDEALALGYSRILTRRLTMTLSESAGLFSNNYSVLNSVTQTDTSVANTALVVTPNTEAFDNQTYYSSTQADVAYQKTARLSFDFGGSGFYVKRKSSNLISANGYQARTDIAYRVTKRTTIGPYYAYSRYNYSGTFGDSDIHTVGGNYSLALNRTLQLRLRGGVTRLETRGLQQVLLDPLVARILGMTSGTQRYYLASYLPDVAVDLTKSFRHGDVSVSFLRGVSPGNGVILTSARDSQSMNYNYSGLRKYGVSVGGGRDSLSSSVQTIGIYHSYYGRANISRALPHSLQSFLSFDYRKLGFTTGQYARNQYRVSIGFGYAPGMGPLKFW